MGELERARVYPLGSVSSDCVPRPIVDDFVLLEQDVTVW
jgi:hypothetical protein